MVGAVVQEVKWEGAETSGRYDSLLKTGIHVVTHSMWWHSVCGDTFYVMIRFVWWYIHCGDTYLVVTHQNHLIKSKMHWRAKVTDSWACTEPCIIGSETMTCVLGRVLPIQCGWRVCIYVYHFVSAFIQCKQKLALASYLRWPQPVHKPFAFW